MLQTHYSVLNSYTSVLFRPIKGVVPSFGSCSLERVPNEDVFLQNHTDFLKMPKHLVLQKIKNSINNVSTFLGSGREAKVYKIEDEPYCVRVPLHNRGLVVDIGENLDFDITNQDKVNHVVAKLDNGITLMRYIEGKNLFKSFNSNVLNLNKDVYKSLIKQISFAFNNDMLCDATPANLIYSEKNKTLTFVDFYNYQEYLDVKEARPLNRISSAILFNYFGKDEKLLKKFVCTLMDAALDEFKFGVKPQLPVDEYDFVEFLTKMNDRYGLSSDSKTTNSRYLLNVYLNDLKQLKKEELYRDTSVKNELNDKLDEIYRLLNQIYDFEH